MVGGSWKPFRAEHLGQRNDAQFAVVLNWRSERNEGVLVVKTSNMDDVRKVTSDEDIARKLGRNARVAVTRSGGLNRSCKGAPFGGGSVSFSNYVKYHKFNEEVEESDNRTLERFHIEYMARRGGLKLKDVCVATNSADTANRYQFQFDADRRGPNFFSAILRSLPRWGRDVAVADPAVPPIIQTKLIRYVANEGNEKCVFFKLRNLDEQTVIQINDLENRGFQHYSDDEYQLWESK